MGTCARCGIHIEKGKHFNDPNVRYCDSCYVVTHKKLRAMKASADKAQTKLVSVLVPYKDDYLWDTDPVSEAPPFGCD